jgi:hypothetical protein
LKTGLHNLRTLSPAQTSVVIRFTSRLKWHTSCTSKKHPLNLCRRVAFFEIPQAGLVDWLVVLSMTLHFPNELLDIKKHRQILFLKVEESNLGVQKTGDAYC